MWKKLQAPQKGVCSCAVPRLRSLPIEDISSSGDSDSKGLRLEPPHYCLIVLSRKYSPLCFMQSGGGDDPSCHSKSHPAKQMDRPASCGALVRTSVASSSIHSRVPNRAADVPASSEIQDLVSGSPTLFILISCCAAPVATRLYEKPIKR